MLELINNTPFHTKLMPGLDRNGVMHAAIVIKGTFEIRNVTPVLVIAKEQVPSLSKDIFLGEPGRSSIKYESDAVWMKPAVDIVLNGYAYAPRGKAVSALDTRLQVGKHHHNVRILGRRFWQKEGNSWRPTAPERFDRLALTYENAYGGSIYQRDGKPTAWYAANPVGKGFGGEKGQYMEEGLELPNLEFSESLIQHWRDAPPPAGFGFIVRNWQPRLSYAGTYDQRWEEERSPLLPENFDERFFNSAHPNLTLPKGSVEGQRVIATNLSESGSLAFDLPEYRFTATANIKGQSSEFQPLLDTVLIEPELLRVTLTWRIAIPCGQQFLHLDQVTVNWRAT